MKSELFIQHICGDCLQKLVNDEGDHSEQELATMQNSLNEWAITGYYPAGMVENTEPSFSWRKCDLCNQLPGDRYEYYFKQKTK